VFDLLEQSSALRDQLNTNTAYFRKKMTEAGFNIRPGTHPIVVSGGGTWLDSKMDTSHCGEPGPLLYPTELWSCMFRSLHWCQ
jgi:hypothetical protein